MPLLSDYPGALRSIHIHLWATEIEANYRLPIHRILDEEISHWLSIYTDEDITPELIDAIRRTLSASWISKFKSKKTNAPRWRYMGKGLRWDIVSGYDNLVEIV